VHLVSWLHHVVDAKVPKAVVATGETYRYKNTHEVPDTVNALLTYPENFTANLTCTFNNELGAESGLEILGTDGSLILRGGTVTFKPELKREDNRWWSTRGRGPRARVLRRSEGAGRRVALLWDRRRRRTESWRADGRDDTYAHIANFFSSVKSRKQPVETRSSVTGGSVCAHGEPVDSREEARGVGRLRGADESVAPLWAGRQSALLGSAGHRQSGS